MGIWWMWKGWGERRSLLKEKQKSLKNIPDTRQCRPFLNFSRVLSKALRRMLRLIAHNGDHKDELGVLSLLRGKRFEDGQLKSYLVALVVSNCDTGVFKMIYLQ